MGDYPGFTGEKFPEIFDIRAMLPQPTEKKPGQLSDEDVEQFFTKGYVVVQDFFKPEELDPIKTASDQLVDQLANKLYKAGKIKNPYQEEGYLTRLCRLEEDFPGANILCFKQMGSVPQFMEGGHLPGLVARHHQCCWGNTWYTMLEEEEMEKTLGVDVKTALRTIPLTYGSFVLFNKLLPHRSLDNMSDHVRWSADLRWQRSSDPVGFFGIKDAVKMRSSSEPDMQVDWSKFDAVNRHEIQEHMVVEEKDIPSDESEFDTRVAGPWMKQWEITHKNKHVHMFERP